MSKFNKDYVNCVEDEALYSKYGYFADDIDILRNAVINDNPVYWGQLAYGSSCNSSLPFTCEEESVRYRFFYYEPCFDLKQARKEGKVIQRYWKSEQEWEEWIDDEFPGDLALYRIKPEEEKPITNRELAHWLAQGNGEYTEKGLRDTSINCYANFNYSSLFQDDPIPDSFLIRKWEDTEWHSPTREYMGLNTQEV